MAVIDNLLKLLDGPRDSALLRFSIGSEYLKLGDAGRAAHFLRSATERDPAYSAAWKLLGKALTETQAPADALAAFERGIAAAEAKGDKQAAKEMAVFARRIKKSLTDDEGQT
ncbi:MAG: tetratricopeptide repeat protein [Rhodocyclaceae bacterium]